MNTVQELINAALRSLGELASGETPTTEESNDAFAALNHLLASWSTEGLFVPQLSLISHSLSGAGSYTIGTGGDINAERPLAIRAAAVETSAGLSAGLEIIDAQAWAAILDKSATGALARQMYYNPSRPLGVIYLWPRPTAGGTLRLHAMHPLPAFTSLGQTIDLPPGYVRALRYGLALELAPEFGRDPAIVLAQAQAAKAALAELNARVLGPHLGLMPPAAPGGGSA